MQEKQKVTLYLPPELHRQLKICSAVEAEPMSAIAERAIVFYLTNPGVVDEIESSHGHVHEVYSCSECGTSLVLRDGEMTSLGNQPAVLDDGDLSMFDQSGEQELVPC